MIRRFAGSGAITYGKQDEVLRMELRNGVHKYMAYFQAKALYTGYHPVVKRYLCIYQQF